MFELIMVIGFAVGGGYGQPQKIDLIPLHGEYWSADACRQAEQDVATQVSQARGWIVVKECAAKNGASYGH